MAAVANIPRTGILLNSPSSSPRNPHLLLNPYLPPTSSSSSASSSSSTDDIATSSDSLNPNNSQPTNIINNHNHNHTRPKTPKIRFAPLPDPRRSVLITEHGQELPLDQEQYIVSPYASASSTTSLPRNNSFPNSFPAVCSTGVNVNADGTPTSPVFEGVDSGQNTETNTVIGTDDGGSESGHSFSSFSVMPSSSSSGAKKERTNSNGGGRWNSKSFLRPLLKLNSKTNPIKGPYSAEEVLTLGTIHLFRSSSRESVASERSFNSHHNNNSNRLRQSSSASLGGQEKRNGWGGLGLKPVMSESGTSSTAYRKRGGSAVSLSSTSSAPGFATNGNSNNRAKGGANSNVGFGSTGRMKGTRLLNGRVYGQKGLRNQNLFATARSEEPAFVEWGYGGMGSVVGGKAQTDQKRGGGKGGLGGGGGTNDDDDDDDGSGMGWVKKRKEAREREKREKEERERKEREAKESEEKEGVMKEGIGGGDTISTTTATPATANIASTGEVANGDKADEGHALAPGLPAIHIRAASPEFEAQAQQSEAAAGTGAGVGVKAGSEAPSSEIGEVAKEKETKEKETKEKEAPALEHITTAVNIPAPVPHRHGHGHSERHAERHHLHGQMSRTASGTSTIQALATPLAEHPGHLNSGLGLGGSGTPTPLAATTPTSTTPGATIAHTISTPPATTANATTTATGAAGTMTPSPLGQAVNERLSGDGSVGSVSEDDDEDDEDEDEDGNSTEKDEEEAESEDEEEEEVRATSRSAGVEKISRHKD